MADQSIQRMTREELETEVEFLRGKLEEEIIERSYHQDRARRLSKDNDRLRVGLGGKDDEIETLQTVIDLFCDEVEAAQKHTIAARAVDASLARHTS